jgi:hypothetical protein
MPVSGQPLVVRVGEILRDRALCLACATREAGASQFATMRAISSLATVTFRSVPGGRCGSCGGVAPVYWV